MSGRREEWCMYRVCLLKFFFFQRKELLHYTTPCLRNLFPLSIIILLAVRFSFPAQIEIRKLGHIGGRLNKIVLKIDAG